MSWPASPGFQERGKFPDVADQRHSVREFFARTQPVRADEGGLHGVGERTGDIACEVVTDEKHLFERVGEQGTAEQVVDPAFWRAGQRVSCGWVLDEARTRRTPRSSCRTRSVAAAGSTGFWPIRWSIRSREMVEP